MPAVRTCAALSRRRFRFLVAFDEGSALGMGERPVRKVIVQRDARNFSEYALAAVVGLHANRIVQLMLGGNHDVVQIHQVTPLLNCTYLGSATEGFKVSCYQRRPFEPDEIGSFGKNKSRALGRVFVPLCANFVPRNFCQCFVIESGVHLTNWIYQYACCIDWTWLAINGKGRRSGLSI